jgi:hypothetical protein
MDKEAKALPEDLPINKSLMSQDTQSVTEDGKD